MGKFIKFLFIISHSLFLSLSYSFSFQIISHDLEYALYKKNRLVWSFHTKAFVKTEEGDIEGTGVYITNKEKGFEVWANKWFYQRKEDKIILSQNVHLIISQYGDIYTEELLFFPKKNLILTDKEILVIKKGFIIKGKGLIYDINTGNFKIKKEAKVKLQF